MDFRNKIIPSDIDRLAAIAESTGFFYDSEIDIVKELVTVNFEKGEKQSGYIFNIATFQDTPVAFTCYGHIPGTADSYDLYWIVVHRDFQGKGIGRVMMDMAVRDIAQRGGKQIWIETSSRTIYEPTRKFYEKYGCKTIAILPDYYNVNDDKFIYSFSV